MIALGIHSNSYNLDISASHVIVTMKSLVPETASVIWLLAELTKYLRAQSSQRLKVNIFQPASSLLSISERPGTNQGQH